MILRKGAYVPAYSTCQKPKTNQVDPKIQTSTISVDGYSLFIKDFFETNSSKYLFSTSNKDVYIPKNCDYAINFNTSDKRNFSLFSNETNYKNLSFQYKVSNNIPEVDDSIVFYIRIVNSNNFHVKNINLKLKEIFDLGFQGEIDSILIEGQDDYTACGDEENISIYPPNWVCCPSGEARQNLSQCEESLSIKVDVPANDYLVINVIFKVTNPPNEPFITGEPELVELNVSPGDLLPKVSNLVESLADQPKGKKGWIIGKKNNNGQCNVLPKGCKPLTDASKAFKDCKAEGGDPDLIIEVKPALPGKGDPDGTWRLPPTGRALFNALFDRSGDPAKCDLAKEKLGKILEDNGAPGADLKIEVQCNGQVVYPAPNQQMRLISGDSIGDCTCEQIILTPWGFEPDCATCPFVACQWIYAGHGQNQNCSEGCSWSLVNPDGLTSQAICQGSTGCNCPMPDYNPGYGTVDYTYCE